MNFTLNDEQAMLADSVAKMLSDRASGPASLWPEFAEFGLAGLPFAEADGGLGCGPVETMVVAQAMGRVMRHEPFIASTVLAGSLISSLGSDEQRTRFLLAMASGELQLALGYAEPASRYNLSAVVTTAESVAGGFRLNGRKTVVLNGDEANILLISARSDDGVGIYAVNADAPGVIRHRYRTIDGRGAADIVLRDVRAERLGTQTDALPALELAIDAALAALAGEAVGVMEEVHAQTVDYLKVRKQFGVPIGSFQALQHRAVDMMVALEQARSMAFYAAAMMTAPVDDRRTAIAAAKIQIDQSCKLVGQGAVQLLGAVGMTDEHMVGRMFRRLTAIQLSFADTDRCLELLATSPSQALFE